MAIDNRQKPAAELLEPPAEPSRSSSYQEVDTDLDENTIERKKAERRLADEGPALGLVPSPTTAEPRERQKGDERTLENGSYHSKKKGHTR